MSTPGGHVIQPHDVVTAWAESCHGPGWGNVPVWYLVRGQGGELQIRCLQPEEQTAEIHALYKVAEAAHKALTAAVRAAVCSTREGQS
jgi:hypothetical protein